MKNIIAIAVLVGLGIIAALIFWEKPNTEKESVKKVIQPVDIDRLDTIKVVRLEGFGKEKHEESYTLKKKEDTWRMVKPVDFPVFENLVELMTKTLGDLRVIDIISEKPEAQEKFAVDDGNGLRLTALAGDEALLDIIVGNSDAGVTFARLPGAPKLWHLPVPTSRPDPQSPSIRHQASLK